MGLKSVKVVVSEAEVKEDELTEEVATLDEEMEPDVAELAGEEVIPDDVLKL